MQQTFDDLGLIPEILMALDDAGYIVPTPIQAQAIPELLAGHDVLGQAQTGTGKTAAFSLPMLQKLESGGLQALILTPTRELAIQIAEAVHRYGNHMGVRVLPIYGGQPYSRQKRRIEKGVHVIAATPGRTLDLIRQGILDLSTVRYAVLDEADEMLKMGFIDDVEAILAATNKEGRQTALFSATLPKEIQRLAQKYMNDPQHIAVGEEEITVDNITQRYYVVRESDKVAALSRLLEVEATSGTLIFTRTKIGAAELSETLLKRGYPATAIHGDLPQIERERIIRRFREGQVNILVATDVVARGVDIPDMSHVINYDIPQLPIEYVHRIGRTGRAGKSGDAITLITPRQRRQLRSIEDYIQKKIEKGKLPDRERVLRQREQAFFTTLLDQMNQPETYRNGELIDSLLEQGFDARVIAEAAIALLQNTESLHPLEEIRPVNEREERKGGRDNARNNGGRSNGKSRRGGKREYKRNGSGHEPGMVRLHMDIGRSTGLKPGDVVYGIASSAQIPGSVIGAIDIHQNETYLDVPEAHVDAVLSGMKRGKIKGRPARLERA